MKKVTFGGLTFDHDASFKYFDVFVDNEYVGFAEEFPNSLVFWGLSDTGENFVGGHIGRYVDAVETSNTSILVGQLAKLLKQNGVDIGQNKLFKYLRDNHYLGKRGEYYNMPTQYSMEMGLFEIKERTIQNPDGSVKTVRTTKVTGKGQTYFVNKFLK